MNIEKMYPYIKAIMFESLSKIPEDRITVIGSEPVIQVDLNTLHSINDFIDAQQKAIEAYEQANESHIKVIKQLGDQLKNERKH